jgi:hypothetical protein
MISSRFYKYLNTYNYERANHGSALLFLFFQIRTDPRPSAYSYLGQKNKNERITPHKSPDNPINVVLQLHLWAVKLLLLSLFGLSETKVPFSYLGISPFFIRYFSNNNSPRYDGIGRLACNR